MASEVFDGARPRKVAGFSLAACAFLCCRAPETCVAGESATEFGFSTVREMARALAAKDFHPEQNADLPEALKKLTYDQYQKIRFRPEHNLWKDDHVRFMAQFFQRGYLYQDPVRIHVVDGKGVSDVAFSPDKFDYDTNRVPETCRRRRSSPAFGCCIR